VTRKRLVIILVIAAALAATVYAAGWFRRDSSLQALAPVEARDTRVGSKIGGRIDQVLVREGDRVKPGRQRRGLRLFPRDDSRAAIWSAAARDC